MFLAVVQTICVNTPMLIFVKYFQVEGALAVQKLILNRPLKTVVGSTKLGCPEATLILLDLPSILSRVTFFMYHQTWGVGLKLNLF